MPRAPKAQSRYRQMQLTLTAELNGRVSYSIKAKALNSAWNEHSVLVRDSIPIERPPETSEEVYELLYRVLRDQFLPGHTT